MKVASFFAAGRERFGVWTEAGLIDCSRAGATTATASSPEPTRPDSVLELIEAGEAGLAGVETLLLRARQSPHEVEVFAADAVLWRAPVLRPSKVCCVAFNNSANSGRILSGPEHPALFTKPASALVGHLGAIECRREYGRVHPEPELAVVIGKRAKNITAAAAYQHVFGYTIHNDITSPTMRNEDTFHYRAIHPRDGDHREIEYVESWVSYPGRYKGSDTFACVGPWIVTKDEIPDPHALQVTCRHGDTLVTDDNTENFFFKVPELLQFISRYMTLEPGDIVSLGTALRKSAQGSAVQNIDLNRLGGPISITIDGIGTLTNTVSHLDY
jgi:2-keto-4-pentenoate hydratase/2-oxohepta-3-ene-1,7-dioic acid hydratase in catechol pathway